MKAVLIAVVVLVLWMVLRNGLFGSLTTGAPAYAPRGNWFTAETPFGNFGGGF